MMAEGEVIVKSIPVPASPHEQKMPSSTTPEQDRTTLSQRRINLVWEGTQAMIAASVTLAMIYCAVSKIQSPELTNSFFLIVGFYFSRTNHTKVGGIGHTEGKER